MIKLKSIINEMTIDSANMVWPPGNGAAVRTEKSMVPHQTKNDLPEEIRRQSIDLLNQSLACCIDLAMQSKQAHWNVKGPFFIGLHKLFDEVYEMADEFVDELAERCVELGGNAQGTVQQIGQHSKLPPYPIDISDGKDHVKALSTALSIFGACVRENSDKAEQFGDMDTMDLFTEVSRAVDKMLWFVEAHLQAKG